MDDAGGKALSGCMTSHVRDLSEHAGYTFSLTAG